MNTFREYTTRNIKCMPYNTTSWSTHTKILNDPTLQTATLIRSLRQILEDSEQTIDVDDDKIEIEISI